MTGKEEQILIQTVKEVAILHLNATIRHEDWLSMCRGNIMRQRYEPGIEDLIILVCDGVIKHVDEQVAIKAHSEEERTRSKEMAKLRDEIRFFSDLYHKYLGIDDELADGYFGIINATKTELLDVQSSVK
jgi:hypothetical protein